MGTEGRRPQVDCEFHIICDGCGNVGLAPLLGAWHMGAVTGGFALLNLRLVSVNPPGSTANRIRRACSTRRRD
jgi:hypothetical protein